MVTKVVMPKLSLTMKEGTVGKWYKKEGETVEKGEPIVELISEKATYDLEAPATGVLRKILVAEGVDAPVDGVLALITAPDEEISKEIEETLQPAQALAETEEKVRASPAAKRLAKEHGIDLSFVKGSGPEGRIVEEDVKRCIAESGKAAPKIKETLTLTGFRKTSAEKLAASFRTAPHSTVIMEVDASNAKKLHEELQVSYTAILVKITAKALLEHPMLNSTLDGNKIKIFKDVNIGVAVATDNGLVVPVVHEANKKTVREINSIIEGFMEKAKQGKFTKEELTGGTFTITNLGMYGVDFFLPIINPPEAAILGVGRIAEKPVVSEGKIEISPVLMLSLAYDHRIVDGAPATQFLKSIKEKLERVSASEI